MSKVTWTFFKSFDEYLRILFWRKNCSKYFSDVFFILYDFYLKLMDCLDKITISRAPSFDYGFFIYIRNKT